MLATKTHSKPSTKKSGKPFFPPKLKVDTKTKAVSADPKTESKAKLESVDISEMFKPNESVAEYLAADSGKYKKTPVHIGNLVKGEIEVRQKNKAKGENPAKYEIRKNQFLNYRSIAFLNKLSPKLVPVIAIGLNKEGKYEHYLSFSSGGAIYSLKSGRALFQTINEHLDLLGLKGFGQLAVDDSKFVNKVENGSIKLAANGFKTKVDKIFEAEGNFGLSGNIFHFEVNADVDIPGVKKSTFKIAKDEEGNIIGEGVIEVDIKNLEGGVTAKYLNGVIEVKGKATISTEKFSGELNLLYADKATADQIMKDEVGVEVVEAEKNQNPENKVVKTKKKKNYALVGWGTVTASLTPWLSGTAQVGMDSKGDVTVKGEIIFGEIELMPRKDRKFNIIDPIELRVGYGIPFLGQVFIFANISLHATTGFGPLILRDIALDGTYSTDPNILQNFKINGALNINAFAGIYLNAKAGVGLTFIGHDIKAGISVYAGVLLKAYAEAAAEFEFIEANDPKGGKAGEAWLRGYFEAAAQLYLQLGGELFVELDSPWWSPFDDNEWKYPMGKLEYPLGSSIGIGAYVEWLVGSKDYPEVDFKGLEFSGDKFLEDISNEPPKTSKGKKDNQAQGTWKSLEEQNAAELGKTKEGEKKGEKVDHTKLPDNKRAVRACGEVADLGDQTKIAPITEGELKRELRRIKSKYAIERVELDDIDDGIAEIEVEHKDIEVEFDEDTQEKIYVISYAAERNAVNMGTIFLKANMNKQTFTKAENEKIAKKSLGQIIYDKSIRSINVVSKGDRWDFEIVYGALKSIKRFKGNKKQEIIDAEIQKALDKEKEALEAKEKALTAAKAAEKQKQDLKTVKPEELVSDKKLKTVSKAEKNIDKKSNKKGKVDSKIKILKSDGKVKFVSNSNTLDKKANAEQRNKQIDKNSEENRSLKKMPSEAEVKSKITKTKNNATAIEKEDDKKNKAADSKEKNDVEQAKQENQKNLDEGIKEAVSFAKKDGVDLVKIRAKIPSIKKRFNMVKLSVVILKNDTKGIKIYFIGKVNPTTNSTPVLLPVENDPIYKYIGETLFRNGNTEYTDDGRNLAKAIKVLGYKFVFRNEKYIIQRKIDDGKAAVHINEAGKLSQGLSKGESKPNHDKYIPQKKLITETVNGYSVEYETKTDEGKDGPTFKIDIRHVDVLRENEDKTEIRKVTGKSLKIKDVGGAHGKSDSAQGGFENAHLIADRFGGSGKNEDFNIYPSSPFYNNKTMGAAERIIANQERGHINRDKDHRFDLTVVAKIKGEKANNSALQTAINKEAKRDNNLQVKEINSAMTIDLLRLIRKDIKGIPGKFMWVNYSIHNKHITTISSDPEYDRLILKLLKKP